MKVYFIRHFKTPGNLERRYIGTTDEELAFAWIPKDLQKYPEAQYVAVSPLKRCRQTAERIFPGQEQHVCEKLRECDFGTFENKNYEELKSDPDYQKWMDSVGTMPFPEGESQEIFRERCRIGTIETITEAMRQGTERLAFVVHGGTIMAALYALSDDKREFYDWQVGNGEWFSAEVKEEEWAQGIYLLYHVQKE